jgi:hypothetical protein
MLHSPHQHKATQFTAINTRSVMRFVLKKTVYLCDMLSYALRSIFLKYSLTIKHGLLENHPFISMIFALKPPSDHRELAARHGSAPRYPVNGFFDGLHFRSSRRTTNGRPKRRNPSEKLMGTALRDPFCMAIMAFLW